jgi:CDP-glucose 4,6-dehydratase
LARTWLATLARVAGLALPLAVERPNLRRANLADRIESNFGDIREHAMVEDAREFHPEIVFHLAAQVLVRRA